MRSGRTGGECRLGSAGCSGGHGFHGPAHMTPAQVFPTVGTAPRQGPQGGGGGGHLCDPASPVTHSEHSRFVPDVIICNRSHAAIAGNSLHATASMRQETDRPATWGAWTRLPGLTPRLPLLRRPGGRGRHACPSGASPHSFLLPYPVLLPSWLRSRPVRTVARRGLRVPPIAGVWVSATSVRFVS